MDHTDLTVEPISKNVTIKLPLLYLALPLVPFLVGVQVEFYQFPPEIRIYYLNFIFNAEYNRAHDFNYVSAINVTTQNLISLCKVDGTCSTCSKEQL